MLSVVIVTVVVHKVVVGLLDLQDEVMAAGLRAEVRHDHVDFHWLVHSLHHLFCYFPSVAVAVVGRDESRVGSRSLVGPNLS